MNLARLTHWIKVAEIDRNENVDQWGIGTHIDAYPEFQEKAAESLSADLR